VVGLEPLPIRFDERDRRYGGVANVGGKAHDVVVGFVRHRVDDAIAVQFALPLSFLLIGHGLYR